MAMFLPGSTKKRKENLNCEVRPLADMNALIIVYDHVMKTLAHLCSLQDRILSYIDNSNIGDSAATRNRLDRLMFRTNERLPGAVLQAQARVLERLRGVSIGSSVSRPSITLDEFSATDVFRIIDFGSREAQYENKLAELIICPGQQRVG
jgi:hypothetical protein